MSYEEIDKSNYGSDVFTKNAEGRYARAKPISTTNNDTTIESSSTTLNGERKKKRAPKIVIDHVDNTVEQSNGHEHLSEEVPRTSKKSRNTTENGDAINEISADQEVPVKSKKKRAPKAGVDSENGDQVPIPTTTTEERIRKKKNKAPQVSPPFDDEFQVIDNVPLDEVVQTSTDVQSKVKKTKKHRAPKPPPPPDDDFVDLQVTNLDDTYTPSGDVTYDNGSTMAEVPDDYSQQIPAVSSDAEQLIPELEKSEYETGIVNAYNNLAQQVDFSKYVGEDQWCIVHLPKSARQEPRSRIRKMLPGGGKDDKLDNNKTPAKLNNQKGSLLSRLRNGVNTLVRDEKNLIFGEQSSYDAAYFDEEPDGVDTDDLHRYAQRLRELEDNDREINPEFLVLRDGKTVYGVHEADADGKMTLSTRKPIYDRFGDQTPDEPNGKKKLISRLRNTFTRNKDKDKDLKGSNSPKPGSLTPDPSGGSKRSTRKSTGKTLDADMVTMANNDPMVD